MVKLIWAAKPLRLVALLLVSFGCANRANQPDNSTAGKPVAPTTAPSTAVLWISIDGLRPDYIARAHPPTLTRLEREGGYSHHALPPFPSLTFPSHVSQVTGTTVAGHGIPGNSFYDTATDKEYSFPPRPDLLRAEPIWTTATKAGKRVAVYDWPFSQNQSGLYASAAFTTAFDGKMTDSARADRLVLATTTANTAGLPPYDLVMGYFESVDKAGHAMGPESKAVEEQLQKTDALVGRVVESFAAANQLAGDGKSRRLIVMITSDHGMAPVTHFVNLALLAGETLPTGSHLITGGGNGHIFLPDSPDKAAMTARMVQRINAAGVGTAWARADIPARWDMQAAGRVGDIFVNLTNGYTFSTKTKSAVEIRPPEQGPRGMHSYDVAEVPDVHGYFCLWSSDGSTPKGNLGTVRMTQMHATAAGLLGIKPADTSRDSSVLSTATAKP